MAERELRQAPWLLCDKAWKWEFGKLHGRIEKWGKRFNLTPSLNLDWEQSMFTAGLGWMNFWFCIDYEYSTWDKSEEVDYPISREV